MRSIEETISAMGPLSGFDRDCIEAGAVSGAYAVAYETEDYSEAARSINGQNGFFRVGHLLGFFESFEIHEIHGEINGADLASEVAHYRAVMAAVGVEL